MDINKVANAANWLRGKANQKNILQTSISHVDVTYIREELLTISKEIENEYPTESGLLFTAKNSLFREVISYPNITHFFINPFVLGKIVGILDVLINKCKQSQHGIWSHVHPQIRYVSEKLYTNGSYANAACDAFIEINARVKKLFCILNPGASKVPDGDAAMTNVFSVNAPMLQFCDQSTETGRNIQKGFMQMLAGAMSALRNPKAHENIEISQEDAIRRIMLASMLMYKIDEAVQYSGIQEQ